MEPDLKQLAEDVLTLALVGGMPDSYWYHDSRIARACTVLEISVSEAQERAGHLID